MRVAGLAVAWQAYALQDACSRVNTYTALAGYGAGAGWTVRRVQLRPNLTATFFTHHKHTTALASIDRHSREPPAFVLLSSTTTEDQKARKTAKMGLDLLCAEILIAIMESLPDLGSLDSFLTALPRAEAAFNMASRSVFESIISGPRSRLPGYTREMVRAVALTRLGTLPIGSFDELVEQFLRNHKLAEAWMGTSLVPLETIELQRDCIQASDKTAAVLRSVVATARHIEALTWGCLDYYLARVRDKSFAPMRYPVGAGRSIFTSGARCPNLSYGSTAARVAVMAPLAQPIPLVDAGPPSWVEEMRVGRLMWFMQLWCDLHDAAQDGRLAGCGWSDDCIRRMQSISANGLAESTMLGIGRTGEWQHHGGKAEIKTVTAYLDELRSEDATTSATSLPWPPADVIAQTREGQEPPPERTDLTFEWYLGEENLDFPGIGHDTFVSSCMENSWILDGATFDSYRRLGFSIWDGKRMHGFGLLDKVTIWMRTLTWRSLLSAEELASIPVQNKDIPPSAHQTAFHF